MTNPQSSDRARQGDDGKKLRPLGRVVAYCTALTVVVGYVLAAVLARVVAGKGSWWRPWTLQLSSSQWYDVLRSDIATVGLIAAGGAAILAYRRQWTGEGQHRLDRQRHDLTERADFRDRFSRAAEQLGHDKPAVRLAGAYAMAQLADDWGPVDVAQRQVCIDVLCAYFRMPSNPKHDGPGEEQVRLTVISVIRQHLQNPDTPTSWCRAELDFTGATFTGGEHFHNAEFSSGGSVSFNYAKFSGGEVYFNHAKFSGGEVYFVGAEFSGGDISFDHADFSGGTVSFDRAKFSGGTVSLGGAKFFGAVVSFDGAEFYGGAVLFARVEFSGGTVFFGGAVFSGGTVSFGGARFSGGEVDFTGAVFSGGQVNFEGVHDWSPAPSGLPTTWPRPPGLTLPWG